MREGEESMGSLVNPSISVCHILYNFCAAFNYRSWQHQFLHQMIQQLYEQDLIETLKLISTEEKKFNEG